MERLTNIEKLEKARKLADRGRYDEAMEQIRNLDVSRLKALTDLSAVADIYEANGYIEEAYSLLRKVYDKSRTRRVLYQLTVLTVKRRDTAQAEQFYREFLTVAPMDADQFVLRFLIDRLEQKDLETQIESLEKLKEFEYVEEWAYELAKLYKKVGLFEKCIRECSDIELWFGDGEIVDKAVALRNSLQPDMGMVQESEPMQLELFTEEEPEQLELCLEGETALFAEEEPVQLEFVWEDEYLEESAEISIEELAEEEPTVAEPVFEEKIPEEVSFREEQSVEELPEQLAEDTEGETVQPEEKFPAQTETISDTELIEKEKKITSPDSLVQQGLNQLEEDDYILTDLVLQWLERYAGSIRKQFRKEKTHQEQMQLWVASVIDFAEQRNMENLLDVVNKSSYRESGLLTLAEDDFLRTWQKYNQVD